jgi:transmembrane sensor
VDWAVRAGVADEIILGTRQRVRRRRQRRLALAGAVVVCLLLAAVWIPRDARSPEATLARTSVAVSVPARQTLADGTLVELRDGAEISVAFSADVRRVALIRGEAHFQVIKDPARPFIVTVDSVAVRAVGTAFSVQRRQSDVEVLVTHGRVAVDRVSGSGASATPSAPQTIATLDAGNRTLVEVSPVAAAPVVEVMAPVEMDRRLAWRTPRLEFSSTPLAEAIPMINEHSAVKLSLDDPALGSLRISGLLRADNVESLFRLLEVEHGIRVEQKSPTEVVLRARR